MSMGFVEEVERAIPLHVLAIEEYTQWLSQQSVEWRNWAGQHDSLSTGGDSLVFASADGCIAAAVVIVDEQNPSADVASAINALPTHSYMLEYNVDIEQINQLVIAWGLASYQFTAYKMESKTLPTLVWPPSVDRDAIQHKLTTFYLVQDLINMPTEDMGPAELAEAVCHVGDEFGAKVAVSIGEQLVADNYPLVYAVGRASSNQPRLIDLRWSSSKPTKQSITLVGKGVCYDTGGLSLKPTNSMALMRKDMGGAAHALGLARLIMSADLPVNLRLLIPAVENAVGGSSYRPGDVLTARDGTTVEIGNTDAEGRLILADALVEASSESPDLLLDFATLTGAARVALGPEVHPVMSNDQQFVDGVVQAGLELNDTVWQLPLYQPYKRFLKSKVADCSNINTSGVGFAGAITAGLFLQQFVGAQQRWAHFDLFAWNNDTRPGKPYGGTVCALHALWGFLLKSV